MNLFETIGDTLFKPFAQFLFGAVTAVPMSSVKILFIAIILGMVAWVFTLKKEKTDPETGNAYPLWRDLRMWAALVLVLQAVGYMVLG